jgi:hypothetical protein
MSTDNDDTQTARCPRCGGLPAQTRRPTPANPFLPKPRSRPTCADCGLDFVKGAEPWGPGDRRASSAEES